MLIEIPDNLANELIELAKEYVSQNKRHQADPCMFTVRQKIKEFCFEGYHDSYLWQDEYSGDYCEYENKEAEEWCKENNYFFDCEEDVLGSKIDDCYLIKRYYKYKNTFESRGQINPFFTAKYCDIYIHNDKHNLEDKEAHSYAFTPQKNHEMNLIAKILTHLGNS